jgi:hypothetical protein
MSFSLRIDTTTMPVYETGLTKPQIDQIVKLLATLDDSPLRKQHEIVADILSVMKDQFYQDTDKLAIGNMIACSDAYFQGMRCSKPDEFRNLILNIVERATPV